MSWVTLDDNFPHHPKVLAVGPVAAWLYICALCYCRKYHTGGYIPVAAVKTLGVTTNPRRMIDALIDARLWEHREGGFQVHDYDAIYPEDADDKATSEVRRQQKRNAGRLGGLASAAKRKQADGQVEGQADTQAESKQPAQAPAQALKGWGGSGVVDLRLGEKFEKGGGESAPLDVWFRQFQDAYPSHRVTRNALTEHAFVAAFQSDPRPAADVWAEMRTNLAANIRSHEWRIKGMEPKLEKYLREGLWRNRLPEAPASTLITEKSARTLTSGAAFVADGGRK